MQLNLDVEDERYIRGKLSEGFESPESVVVAALALMREQDAQSDWVRRRVQEGAEDADAGRVIRTHSADLLSFLEGSTADRIDWRQRTRG